MELPDELLLCIFSHLTDAQDKLALTRVSRQWRIVALDDALWRGCSCSLSLHQAILVSRWNRRVPLSVEFRKNLWEIDSVVKRATLQIGWESSMLKDRVVKFTMVKPENGADDVQFDEEVAHLHRIFEVTGFANIHTLDLRESAYASFQRAIQEENIRAKLSSLRFLSLTTLPHDWEEDHYILFLVLNSFPRLESLHMTPRLAIGSNDMWRSYTHTIYRAPALRATEPSRALRVLSYGSVWPLASNFLHQPDLFPNLEEVYTDTGFLSEIATPQGSPHVSFLPRLRVLCAIIDTSRHAPPPCLCLEELDLRVVESIYHGDEWWHCTYADRLRPVFPRLSRLTITFMPLAARTDVTACEELVRVPFLPCLIDGIKADTTPEVRLKIILSVTPTRSRPAYDAPPTLRAAVRAVMTALAAERGLVVTEHEANNVLEFGLRAHEDGLTGALQATA